MERLTQEQYPNVPAVVLECLNQMVEIDEREVLVLQNRVTDLCSKLADAQATVEAVEALQADNRTYINERHENMKQLEELREQVEALTKARDKLLLSYEQSQAVVGGLLGELEKEHDKIVEYDRWLSGGVYFTTAEYEKHVAEHSQQVEALQRERDEAIREHGKESGFWGRSCARLLDKRDELQAALTPVEGGQDE